MTDELKAEREAFEKWWAENFSYVNEKLASLKQYAWFAWQARAKLDRTHTTGGHGDE